MIDRALREREAAALYAREAASDRGALGQRVRFNAIRREAAPEAGRVTLTFLPVSDWPLTLGPVT